MITRENIKQYILQIKQKEGDETISNRWQPDILVEIIDQIYDSFEEAMKPKTCEGCKQSWEPNNQTFHKYFCSYLRIPVHGNFYCNRYEPKDTQ